MVKHVSGILTVSGYVWYSCKNKYRLMSSPCDMTKTPDSVDYTKSLLINRRLSCTVEYSIFVGKHVQSSWVKRSTNLRTQLSTIIIFINGNHAKNYTSSILYCLFWKHKSRIQEPTNLPLWAINGNSGPRIYVLSQ